MCVHFRTRDKDGGHTNRSATIENPMLHANFMALCFTEPELLLMEVLCCGNRDFRPLLLLWPWPWPDDLHIRIWPVFPGDLLHVQIWTSYIKAFESYRLTDIETYIQTRPKLYTTPLCRWSISKQQRVAHQNTWPELRTELWMNSTHICLMRYVTRSSM